MSSIIKDVRRIFTGGSASGGGGGGTITSVSGTTNRITSTGGTTPIIDISASYVGQTSITTLGTIIVGTWASLFAYIGKSATYAAATTDYTIECTTGTFTVTLPTAVGVTGKVYNIKNSGTGVITVATTSAQTIDGNSTELLIQYNCMTVQSNGTNWIII